MNQRRLLPLACVATLALLLSRALVAQEIAATWQGTLDAGRPLRIVIKIEGTEGALRGTMYSIDQGGQAIATSAITAQGATVRFAVPAINGTYEGRLAADGASITGTWSQGGGSRPLTLTRATPDTAWAIPTPPPPIRPMAADAVTEFDVATIKPSDPNRPGRAYLVRGRQFSTLNTTLSNLVAFSYGVHARQIVNGPEWMESDKYDLLGQPLAEGQPSQRQWNAMLQHLLGERFQLVFHREKRELPVYAITTLRTPHKLTKSQSTGSLPGLFFRRPGLLPAQNATVADLAGVMQGAVLDRPVVDQTGIEGRFDFTLNWTPDQFQFAGLGANLPPPPDNATAPNLFEAFQEQLGLRLEATRAPAEVLVIDKVAKPTVD